MNKMTGELFYGCLAVLFALNEQDVEKLRLVKREERSDYMCTKKLKIYFLISIQNIHVN